MEYDEGYVHLCQCLDHEYEKAEQVSVPQLTVQGRLRSHSQFWVNELEPSSFVRDSIMHGYRILLIWCPDPVYYTNSRSASEHANFFEEGMS